MRNIPKSLHTVTAFVNLARRLRSEFPTRYTDAESAVLEAAEILGYGPDCEDSYRLCVAAIAQVAKGFDL